MFAFVIGRLCMSDVGSFFFFNDTATTEIYTLSLHDALPISTLMAPPRAAQPAGRLAGGSRTQSNAGQPEDRKSTRLNSSHSQISYAVFCLKKKKETPIPPDQVDIALKRDRVKTQERLIAWLH